MKNNLRMLGLALCMLPMYLHAETQQDMERAYQPAQEHHAQSANVIPAGTIIPLRLNSAVRSDKGRSGDRSRQRSCRTCPWQQEKPYPLAPR